MASSRLSGPTGFALGVAARAIVVSGLAIAIFVAVRQGLFATGAVLFGGLVLVVLDLVRSTRAADQLLAQFVDGVIAEGHDRPTVPAGLRELGGAIRRALDRLAAVRADRQQRTDFLEALTDTVSASLLVIDDQGVVVAANRSARLGLGATLGPLVALTALGQEAAPRLLEMRAGAREIVRLANQQAMLVQVSGFTTGSGARRLISLQSVSGDLDAVEIKAWQDLVRVLAHEMMNSLTVICSLSESIAGRLGAEGATSTDTQMVEAAQVIARRSEGLMHFVERYRRLTDAPQILKTRTSAVDLARRLDRVADALIAGEAVAYASHVQPSGLMLHVDEDLLEQAAINLLKNAIDAVRSRPDAALRLEIGLDEDQVALTVSDNGPGLSAVDAEGAFVPFFTTKAGGSGIGLTLARQIALAHGGRLEHLAREPNGAVFRLTFPAT